MKIFDPHITGSLSVSASAEIQGDLIVSGTIYGTAQISGQVQEAVSASHAASYLLTSSFENYTGSVATTGSNVFKGDQTISGSLLPEGTLTHDIGSDGQRWRDIYLAGNTINLGGTKITKNDDGNVEIKDGSNNLKKIVASEIEIGVGASKKVLKVDNGKFKLMDTADTRDELAALSGSFTGSFEGDGSRITNVPASAVTGLNLARISNTTATASISNAGLITNVSVIPDTTDTIDLGSPTKQWRDLYLSSGSLYINGQQVLSTTGTELRVTTDSGESIKIIETGSDTITLQTENGDITLTSSGTGNIELDAPIQITAGNKILSSDGNSIVFGNGLIITGSIELSGNVDGVDIADLRSDVDAILSGSTADKDSFAEIVQLINSVDTTNDQAFAAHYTASNNRFNSIESTTSSFDGRLDALETKSGSVDTLNSTQNNRLSSLETESGSIRSDFNTFTSSVPFAISGSDILGNTYDKSFTKLQFDDSTGLNVTEPEVGTAFVSLGSHFKDIFIAGEDILRATGSDELEITSEGGIDITTSLTDTNGNGYSKELKFSTTNLSSSINTRLDNISGSLISDIKTKLNTENVVSGSEFVLNSTSPITQYVDVTVTQNGGRYYIDGVITQIISLAKGLIYRFDVSDPSLSGHPFRFSTTADGTHGGGSEYTNGVTVNGTEATDGAYVQIVVNQDTPQTLYYYCVNHGGMGSKVFVGGAGDTDSITEGTNNLYYTDARVKTKLDLEDVVSGSIQIVLTGTTGYGDLNTRLGSIESFTASIDDTYATDQDVTNLRNTLNSYTSSTDGRQSTQDGRLNSLETKTGSLQSDISGLDGRLDSIEIKTGSLDGRVGSLETESGSMRTTFNSYTSSNDQSFNIVQLSVSSLETESGSIRTDFNAHTSSANGRLGSLESFTASIDDTYATDGDVTNLRNDLNAYTSSNDGRGTVQDGRLNSLETASGSIRTDFNSVTSSFGGRLNSLETESGSIRTTLNSYTSSNNTTNTTQNNRLSALETESGSIRSDFNTITGSFDGRLDSLETTSGSHNTRIGNLETFESKVDGGLEFTGSNVTIKGDLLVKGTETRVNSTTVEVSDNIISLNGSGAANAGIEVRDATSPGLLSGSLIWDGTNNYWKGGTKGSEERVLLNSDLTTINGRIGSLETQSGSIRSDFNSYTSSNDTTNTTQNSRLTSLESATGSYTTTDYYTTGATFDTASGVIRGTRNDGGSWSVDIDGRYLTSHPSITAASSSDNSGRTYIQDILLDGNGHVTGLTTATETVVNTDTIDYVSDVTMSGNSLRFTGVGSAFTGDIDLSQFLDNTDEYTTGATFNTGNGVITFTRNDGDTYTVDIDGRYLQSESDTLATVTSRGSSTSTALTFSADGSATSGTINIESNDPFIRFHDNGAGGTADKKKWDLRAIGASGYEKFEIRTINDANNAFSTKLAIAHGGDIIMYGAYNHMNFNNNTDDNNYIEQIKPDGTAVGRMGFDGYSSASAYYTEFRVQTRSTGESVLTDKIYLTSANDLRFSNLNSFTLNGHNVATQNWVTSQSYLTQHPTISAATSSDNGGRTYIQDILLDANGHVTGLTTATETVVNTDEYTTGGTLNTSTGIITFTRNDGDTYTVDISATLSDVTVTGATYDSGTQTLTMTKSDGDSFNVTGFAVDTDVNWYLTGATFSGGTLTLSVKDYPSSPVTVSLDGRYSLTSHNHDSAYVNVGGDTMTGNLTGPKYYQTQHSTVLSNSSYATEAAVYANASAAANAYPGYGFHKSGVLGVFLYATDRSTLRLRGDGGTDHKLWHDGNLTNVSQLSNDSGYITGYTNTYLTGATFSTSNGIITFTKNDGNTVTVDIDGKYAESGHSHNVYDLNNFNTGQDPNTYLQSRFWSSLNGGTAGNYPSAYNGVVNLGMDASHGLQFSYHYGATDDALWFRHKSDNPSAPNGSGWQGWQRIASQAWVSARGYLTSYNNYYVTGATFNTGNGVITYTRNDGNTVTVDIDGRYAYYAHQTTTNSDFNNARASGIYTLDYGGQANANSPDGGAWHALWQARSGGTRQAQITIPYNADNIYYRRGHNATSEAWNDWVRIWDTNDFSSTQVTNWDTAYAWGNHADVGYLTGYTDTNYYTTGATLSSNIATFTRNDGGTYTVDLNGLVDVTVTGGTYNGGTATLRLNKSDGNSFDVTGFTIDTNTYITGATFGTGDGVITLTRNNGTTTTVDIDGRYLQLGGGTMTGNINFSSTEKGITWEMNTDAAYIKFFNTGDGDTNSRLEYSTSDNGNEYHRWMISGTEYMNLKTGGLTINGTITATGYNKSNWDTAYTYSQVGHLPLAGGTLSGDLDFSTGHGRDKIDLNGSDAHTFGTETYHNTYGPNTWNSGTIGHKFYANANTVIATIGTGGNPGSRDSIFYGKVTLESSTSGSTIFDIQGTSGQLFSITDDLTGDLFGVSDASGVPILKVNASGAITMDTLSSFYVGNNKVINGSGNIVFDGPVTTTNQGRGIYWTGYDKEGTTDLSDNAHILHTTNSGGLAGSVIEIKSQNDSNDGVNFVTNSNDGVRINGNVILNAANYSNYPTHPSVSAASSSNNSGRTYIQDILLDSYGHITGITTATETVVNTDTDRYVNSASFNTGDGVLTLTRAGSDTATVTVDLDGRYAYSSHDHNRITENATITYGASQLQWMDQSGAGGTGLNGSNPGNPFSDWFHHIIMNHANSGGYYVDIAACFHSDQVYFRRLTNGSMGSWREFIHSGNIGSQSVNYATSAGSATSAVDSDKWDGYQFADYLNQSVKTDSKPLFGAGSVASYIRIGDQVADDNTGGWNKGVQLNAVHHGRFRIRTTASTYGAIETYYWADSTVSPSIGIYGSTTSFKFTGSISNVYNAGGNIFLHNGNVTSYTTNASSFSNVSSYTFNHGLGTSNLIVQVYDSNGDMFWPSNIRVTSTQVILTFAANRSGYAVAMK